MDRSSLKFWCSVRALTALCIITACNEGESQDDEAARLAQEGPPSMDAGVRPTTTDAALQEDAGPPLHREPPAPYRADQVLDVAITVQPADWDRIREEGRSANEIYSGCLKPDFAYTTVSASARVDGVSFSKVGLHKKGFIGSLSAFKPSLRLLLDKFEKQALHGQKDLTLNNSHSDPSYLRQCLAYEVFAAAGVPASRCAFARVTVNGQALGLYVNVEPVKKPLLRRSFPDDGGNLYEGGAGADFIGSRLQLFEKKTHESDPDISDLAQLSAALETEGEQLVEKLSPLVDLEAFYRYWAVETLIGHWDSFTGNANNFYVYHEPASGKFYFIPSGPDQAFSSFHPFLPAGARPAATYAWSRLPARLYAYGPTRQRYHEVLRMLLDTVWREPALRAEIDRMVALLGLPSNSRAVTGLRSFVQGRRAVIERELATPDAPWSIAERQSRVCNPAMNSAVSGTFATTWNAEKPSATPTNTLSLVIDGRPVIFESVAVSAGTAGILGVQTGPTLLYTAQAQGLTFNVMFNLSVMPPSGAGEIHLHGLETLGVVMLGKAGSYPSLVGYVGEGKIVFERATPAAGAEIVGRFEGNMAQLRSGLLKGSP